MYKRRRKRASAYVRLTLVVASLLATTCSAVVVQAVAATSAQAAVDPASGAVAWAQARLGQSIYSGMCLQFVHDAYSSGGGVEIGSAATALAYWNNHASPQEAGTNPPVGALVFWGATTGKNANPDGHVALSLGNGTVISSNEESTSTIHTFAITARNGAGYPYLGWMMPPGVSVPTTYSASSGVSATDWGPGRLDVFGRTSANQLTHIWYNGSWHPWESLGGCITSAPSAVAWASGRLDVFARGCDGTLDHIWFDNSGWHPWESLGGCLDSGPSATSMYAGHLDLFVEGCNSGQNIDHIHFNSAGWSSWESYPGCTNATPSVVSWSNGREDLFVRDCNNNALDHSWYQSSWSNTWESFGGCLVSGPGAVSMYAGQLDIYVQACNATQNIEHIYYQNGAWSGWCNYPGVTNGSPAVDSWANGRMDLFTRGNDGTLGHSWYQNSWSNAWENLGGNLV